MSLLRYEEEAARQGYRAVAGVDEAGRGPLAGPVTAAAVILPPGADLPGCDDSKKLTAATRESLVDSIHQKAIAVAVVSIGPEVIDTINILQATRLAMLEAVKGLTVAPDYLLIDGNKAIDWPGEQQTVVKGDSLSLSIAAASIIAKVTRDRLMEEYADLYPGYGFEGHKGYGTATHLLAIRKLGPCPIHRMTFKGVRPEETAKTPGQKNLFDQGGGDGAYRESGPGLS